MDINELHRRAAAGDPNARNEFFRVLADRFEQFALRRIWDKDDADDIVQEALMLVAEKYRTIDFERSFAAWAYRVFDNRVLAYLKTKGRNAARIVSQVDMGNPGRLLTIDPLLKTKLLECLQKVHTRNHRYARVLNLHYQGYNTAEICERLNLTRNGLYLALSRARSSLKHCLDTGEVK